MCSSDSFGAAEGLDECLYDVMLKSRLVSTLNDVLPFRYVSGVRTAFAN